VNRVGNTKIILRDSLSFERYVLNITVKPIIFKATIYQTERKFVKGLYRSWNYKNPKGTGSVSIYEKEAYARKVGKVEFEIYDDGIYLGQMIFTVLPKPKAIELKCVTELDRRCTYSISNNGYYYTKTSGQVVEVDTGKTTFRIKGKSSGTIKLYVKARYGNYISHIITVVVKKPQVELLHCYAPA